jgi:hypothetical protein
MSVFVPQAYDKKQNVPLSVPIDISSFTSDLRIYVLF